MAVRFRIPIETIGKLTNRQIVDILMPPLDDKGKPIVFFDAPVAEATTEKKPEKDLEATYQEDLEKWILIVGKLGIKRDEAIRSFKIDRDAKIAAKKKREASGG